MSPTLRNQEALPRAARCSMLGKQLGSVGEDARKGCIHALRGPLHLLAPEAALSPEGPGVTPHPKFSAIL